MFLKQIYTFFIGGFLAIIPFAITTTLLSFSIEILSKWLNPLHYIFPLHLFGHIPYIEILIAIFYLIIVGILIEYFSAIKIFNFLENNIVSKIPLISNIYFGIKKVFAIIFHKKNPDEKQLVAWVRLPNRNIYCLGLMTGKLEKELSPEKDKNYFSFFVPHTPNPISGYYIVAEENDCIFTSITRQEAISMVVSGGIIKPEPKDKK